MTRHKTPAHSWACFQQARLLTGRSLAASEMPIRFTYVWAYIAFLFYAAILLYALRLHIMWQSVNVWLGVMALPIVTNVVRLRKGNTRYAWVAILLTLFCIGLPVKTLLYGAVALSVLFTVECFFGKTNLLPLVVLGMMSPMFQYLADIFSFPIRLQLTEMAGKSMQCIGSEIQVKGNMIYYGEHACSVDPACMGLNMLVTALLLQVLLVAIYQKKYGRTGAWWQLFLLLGLVTGFNIVSNLIRIVCLVQLKILPGTVMHEVMGIVCLLVYVVLPAIFITRWVVKRYGIIPGTPTADLPARTWKRVTIHVMLAVLVLMAARAVVQRDRSTAEVAAAVAAVPGYAVQRISNDVIKLQNAQSLVYIKPIEGFYSADHNPMICWRGSGYTFKQVEESSVNGQPVYIALLQNEVDTLYTAWWYDSGVHQTIGQFTWRWNALRHGTNYALINVTATSRLKLEQEIAIIQEQQLLKPVLTATQSPAIPRNGAMWGKSKVPGFAITTKERNDCQAKREAGGLRPDAGRQE